MPNEIKNKEIIKQSPKSDFKKDKKQEFWDKKTKYTPQKPTWEKDIKPINKKELIDPTK